MDDQGLEKLRTLLHAPFAHDTHKELSARFERLGLTRYDVEGTKRERVTAVIEAIPASELSRIAEQMMTESMVTHSDGITIQDTLWAGSGPTIVERTRRELAEALDIEEIVGLDTQRFLDMIGRWWDLDRFDGLFIDGQTLREKVIRHVFRNPGDWSVSDLFTQLDAFEAPNPRFAGFLEDLVSPKVVLDEAKQRRLVYTINNHLRRDHLALREDGTHAGYPVFRISATGVAATPPKTLVFSGKFKPDIRLSSVPDNRLEIVDNGADALIYDRPIGSDGLRWRDLHRWWCDRHPTLDADTAKSQLYQRLGQYLPESSPPQRLLYRLYHEIHGQRVWDLPALLPEVWLHWDHQTVRQRGAQALLNQRMDFLLLHPGGHRVVLEVDGKTHYTDQDGNASPQVYARNTRIDRNLRMRGYEVFRFGGAELTDPDTAKPLLTEFFTALFDRFADPRRPV
ncbi:AbiJ-related protein [Nocardia beijingensis]|uniref:AbiJ-NTD3 domain-containing protein n=1 Tax=Nocardia beijingensis TaxID=95162 RepID=A0ABW7WDY7_9NOCA